MTVKRLKLGFGLGFRFGFGFGLRTEVGDGAAARHVEAGERGAVRGDDGEGAIRDRAAPGVGDGGKKMG